MKHLIGRQAAVFRRAFTPSSFEARPESELKYSSASEAVSHIGSGQTVFVQGASMTPTELVSALSKRAGPRLERVSVVSIHTDGVNDLVQPEAAISFRANSFFLGANMRQAVADGRADYTPAFLSEIPVFFRNGTVPVDVAMVQVSPPDRHGYCSLGTSVDVTAAACEVASTVIALVNPQVPRTHGDGLLHVSKISAAVMADRSIAMPTNDAPLSQLHMNIGAHVASLIPNGATVQAGIGGVPDAALLALSSHRDLGVHTEMFSDGLLKLHASGAITNAQKNIFRHKIVTSFAGGSAELIDFVHDNPDVHFLESNFVNDPTIISQNPKVAAINSAIEIDLTGQVVADSIGKRIYSGVGGQMDFMRGAALSPGGRPILALPSRTPKGAPRIVPFIKECAGVVTTRAHVYYVVTEYGIAELHGRCLRDRAHALVAIAHPDDREELERAACERYGGKDLFFFGRNAA